MAIGKNKRKRLKREQEQAGQDVVQRIINTPIIDTLFNLDIAYDDMMNERIRRQWTQTFISTPPMADVWRIVT